MLYPHSNRLNVLISNLYMVWSVLLRKVAVLVAKCCEIYSYCEHLFFKLKTGLLYIIRTGSTSWFQICIYYDLFKVTRGHRRSLKGQNRRIMVEPSQLVGIYSRYICFDSKFCVEFKFKIIWGQFRSSKVIKGQISVKTVEIGSNWAD